MCCNAEYFRMLLLNTVLIVLVYFTLPWQWFTIQCTHLERGQNTIAGHSVDCYALCNSQPALMYTIHPLEIGCNTMFTVEFGDNDIVEHNILLHT